MDDQVARERVARVEALLEELDAVGDPAVAASVTELVQALLDLYGEGLARIVGRLGEDRARAATDDELVRHLLVLHGLHPVPLETRVLGALESVRPYLESHGGDVELVSVDEGVAVLRMQGSCDGCPSSAATVQLAIEDAIHEAAPEIEQVVAQGAALPAEPEFLQLEVTPAVRRSWAPAGPMTDVNGGGPVLKEVGGEDVLFVRLSEKLYAYRPTCPGCGGLLGDGPVDGRHLSCATCGHRYDLRRAGRCEDVPGLHLDPVPLLVDGHGGYKVALA
jgi:Fe-S cluster biogenesis protein NfuA/nitrite reductase/ring-hydroxylating ferredoxin subunit